MTKNKWQWVLIIIYVIATIFVLVNMIDGLIFAIQHSSQNDDFYFSPTVRCIMSCTIYSPLFIAEYVMYSSLKYILFAEDKKRTRLIWQIIKLTISAIVFVDLLRFITLLQM